MSILKNYGKKFRNFLEYYRFANVHRQSWFNLKWRVFLVLLFLSVMLIILEFIKSKYLFYIVVNPISQNVSGSAVEKLFYWFFSGTLTGAFFSWLMFEGEYALGVYKTASKLEKEMIGKVKTNLEYSPKTRNKMKVTTASSSTTGLKTKKK